MANILVCENLNLRDKKQIKKEYSEWGIPCVARAKRYNWILITGILPEGIRVKPLYTEDDLKSLHHQIGMPGLPPLQEDQELQWEVQINWTIRQYAGFSTAEESNKFYKEGLKMDNDSSVVDLARGRGDSDTWFC